MNPDASDVLDRLMQKAAPYSEFQAESDRPGIYAVFFVGGVFPWPEAMDSVPPGDLIYIGKSESCCLTRTIDEHFSSGKTGSSTLRRTLGALLLDGYSLEPEPRSATGSGQDYRCYKFSPEGEDKLTEWMMDNLGLSLYEYDRVPSEIRRLEAELVHRSVPILNLQHNLKNPFRKAILSCRARCAQLARLSDSGV